SICATSTRFLAMLRPSWFRPVQLVNKAMILMQTIIISKSIFKSRCSLEASRVTSRTQKSRCMVHRLIRESPCFFLRLADRKRIRVGLTKCVLLHLAHGVAWQLIDLHDFFGYLEVCQLRLETALKRL